MFYHSSVLFKDFVSAIDREKLLTLVDKEGNTALHAAVNSGDLKTVEVCLDYGSQIDIQQVTLQI